MKEYTKITELYYKGNCYNMYIDNKNKHFFLKNDGEGNLSYLTIEEFIDLSMHLTTIPNVMNIETGKERKTFKEKIKMIPKVIAKGVAVTLTAAIIMTGITDYQSAQRIKAYEQEYTTEQYEQMIDDYVSYDTGEETTVELKEEGPLKVDTYLESDWLKYTYIYDMDYLDKVLDYDSVTNEQIKDVIKNNPKISSTFKPLLYEYCNALAEKYPNAENRVLYENLKTLEVVECDDNEMISKTLNFDAAGCYVRTENKIYVKKDHEYKKGTWDYQVIFHELSHCLRTRTFEQGDKEIKIQVEGQNFNNLTTSEALNSLFAVSLFDYEENDIAYQLQSNYHKTMIESMDNYSLEDYANHSESYYAKKLNEFNGNEEAVPVLNLIETQYDDYHSDSINNTQESYYPIYDYISNMYYKTHINSDMSYSEAKQVTDDLIEQLMFDVPEEYNIDTDHFYDYLQDYCETIGINVGARTM